MKDYYYILGVDGSAKLEEIKKAYRKLSHKFHPDKNPGDKFFEDRFKAIQEAYSVLSESELRRQYDINYRRHFGKQQRTPPEVLIVFFRSDKNIVEREGVLTFYWSVKNAQSVEIEGIFKDLPNNGSKKLRLKSSSKDKIIFTLKASNSYSIKTEKIEVKLTEPKVVDSIIEKPLKRNSISKYTWVLLIAIVLICSGIIIKKRLVKPKDIWVTALFEIDDEPFNYSGNVLYDLPHGKGRAKYLNGVEYMGYFKNGKKHGNGKLIYSNGDIFIGEFKSGIRSGYGYFKSNSGYTYEGEYLNGIKDGYGVSSMKNQFDFEGNFKDDMRNGFGVLKMANGEIYEGNFVNNERTGYGKLKHVDGTYSEGEFLNGVLNGRGKVIWIDGDKYEGDWVNGKQHGNGIYTWSNGAYFKGSFVNDDIVRGIMVYSDGNTYEGLFTQGKYYKGIYTINSGDKEISNCPGCVKFKGTWKWDKKNGLGICYGINDKIIYVGEFKDDKPISNYPQTSDNINRSLVRQIEASISEVIMTNN